MDCASHVDLGGGFTAFVADGTCVSVNVKAFHKADIDGHRLVDEFAVGVLDIQRREEVFVIQ